MLDLKFVRKHKELVERSLTERGINNLDLNYLFFLDNKRKELLNKLDSLRKKKRIMTQGIESLVIMNKKVNPTTIERIRGLNNSIKNYEKELVSYEQKIKEFLMNLPNIPHPSVPRGLPGKPDKIVRRWGRKPDFSFSPRTYLEIGKELGIIDFSENLPILGFDVIFYKEMGAKLQRAIINFLMDLYTKRNYIELFPPVMAEGWPILKLFQGKIFEERELPVDYCTYLLCFRKDWNFAEDIKNNLKRVRQFDSIESIKIIKPEESNIALEKTVKEVEQVMQLLELSYEVTMFTRGNLDYVASRAYRIKFFSPGLDMFLEIAVCNNLGDFFSRDMNIRYRDTQSKTTKPVHIIHANLIIPRAMIAILENFQQVDGSIFIPKILRPYFNNLDRISNKNEKS